MDPADIIAWVTTLGLGGALSTFVNWLTHRSETSAETESITVATAETVVGLVNRQLDHLQKEVHHLEEEIQFLRLQMKALDGALEDRGGNPDEVLADILDRTPYKRPH